MSSKKESQSKASKAAKPTRTVQNKRSVSEQGTVQFELDTRSETDELPSHSTAQRLRQSQILQLQRIHGNAYVQRLLTSPGKELAGLGVNIQTAAVEATPPASATGGQPVLPRLSHTAIYWSVNYKDRRSYVIPRRSFNLQQLATYIFGNPDATANLASLNGISPEAPLGPGMRIRVNEVKGFVPTPGVVAQFRAAPKVPSEVGDPAGWFAAMGVSSPEEFQTRKKELDLLVDEDFKVIVSKLDETHFSDSDESQVLGILKRWAEEKLTTNSMTYPYGGYYFDQLLKKLRWKTKKIGWISDEITDYYSIIFNHFDKSAEARTLVNQYSKLFRGDTGLKELSAADAVIEAVKGVPGAITMTAGAFIGMLPGKYAKKASGWLNKTGKGYLKAVGWDDDMIEMSAGISGMTGMAVSALMPGGPAAKLAQFWSKAEKIVSALEKLGEIRELLENLGALKNKIQTRVEAIIELVSNPDKLVSYLLGFEEDQTGIADWVLNGSTEEDQAAGGTGVAGVVNKIKGAVSKVRKGLQPLFKVRARFIELMEVVGGLVLQVPMAEELLEMALNPKKRNLRTFRRIVGRFSIQLGDMLQGQIDAVRESIEAKIEAFFDKKELLTRDKVFEQVADFAKQLITKEYPAIADIMNVLDSDNSKLKEHVVKKLLPDKLMGVVDVVNEKFQSVMAKFQPAVQFVRDGLKFIAEGIKKSLRQVIVKPLTDALMRSPDDESSGAISAINRKRFVSRQLSEVNSSPNYLVQTDHTPSNGIIQRAVNFDTLRGKLVKRFGQQAIEAFSFGKATTKEDRVKFENTRDQVARLRGREVKSQVSPVLPVGYYYTPAGASMPTGIKRKANLKNFLPKLIIKRTKTRSVIELGFFEKHIKQKQSEEAEQAHKAVIAELGSEAEKLLKGRGSFAPGRPGHGFTAKERDSVDDIGYKSGCHSSGVLVPGTVLNHSDPEKKATRAYKAGKPNWIPDHQPPDSVWRGGGAKEGIRFYPHSKAASSKQRNIVSLYKSKMMKRLGRSKSDWARGIKSKWFWS